MRGGGRFSGLGEPRLVRGRDPSEISKRPGVLQLFLSDMVKDVTVGRWLIRQFSSRVKTLHQSRVSVPRGEELSLPVRPVVKKQARPGGVMSRQQATRCEGGLRGGLRILSVGALSSSVGDR